MEALLITIIGVLLTSLFGAIAAWWRAKADAAGWKVSYEREKERSAKQDEMVARAALATEIATKTATALQDMLSSRAGGTK